MNIETPSPFFSIIVPVYNVEGLLRLCIDSIYKQTFTDFEVIVVDDASTDSSGRIIKQLEKEYKLNACYLDENIGLAGVRNHALSMCSGDYVLFVDSDDEIEEDLLLVLSKKIKKDNSDVVVFNHYREWITGRIRKNLASKLLSSLSFDVIEKNDIDRKIKLFDNLNIACNKAYKLSFLLENNISFSDGYYEDIYYNYKVIFLASSITVTPYVGYKYRQRPGSILNSKSDKHKDITKQYRRLYEFLSLNDEDMQYTKKINDIFLKHIFNLLIKQSFKLTTLAKKSILNDSKAMLSDYNIKPTLFEKQYKVIKSSSLFIVNILSLYFSVISNPKLKKIKSKVSMKVKLSIYKSIFSKMPIKEELAVFESYWGKSYSCNPKYISEYLESNTNIKTVWFGNDNFYVGNSEFVKIKTLKYFYYLARAKYLINNANLPNYAMKRSGSIHVETKHGTPLKKMGTEFLKERKKTRPWFDALGKRCERWDFVISSNPYSTETWKLSFPYNYKTIETGYPRNDILVNNKDNECLIESIKLKLNIENNKKVILFMPTFRDYHKEPDYYLDFEELMGNISSDYVVLIRAHYFKSKFDNFNTYEKIDSIIDVTDYDCVEELYLASDVLITDYSSCMFDYANLKKPIILYTPDFEQYSNYRGMYFDILKESPGAVAFEQEDLVDILISNRYQLDENYKKLNIFHDKFCTFDDGNAAHKVYKTIIG